MDKLKVKNDFKHFYLRLIFQRIQVSKLNHCLFHCTVWTNTHAIFIVRDSYANLLTSSWSKPVCLASLSVIFSGQSPVAEEILSFLNVEKWSVSFFQGNSKQLLKEEGGQEQFHPGALWIKNWILVYSSFMVRVKLGWGRGQEKKGCWALSSKSFTNRAGSEPPSI